LILPTISSLKKDYIDKLEVSLPFSCIWRNWISNENWDTVIWSKALLFYTNKIQAIETFLCEQAVFDTLFVFFVSYVKTVIHKIKTSKTISSEIKKLFVYTHVHFLCLISCRNSLSSNFRLKKLLVSYLAALYEWLTRELIQMIICVWNHILLIGGTHNVDKSYLEGSCH